MTNRLVTPDICPTCSMAIHPRPDAVVTSMGIGTYTAHGHVICPCGWWAETGAEDNPSLIIEQHLTQEHQAELADDQGENNDDI